MKKGTPATPKNEEIRLKELKSYNVLDTLPEQCFDDLTAIASQICEVPISLVSLIDEKRQWFKSHHGLDATETPRELAFCAHAILDPENVFYIPDSFKDQRFSENPLATGAPHVRFYAGAPLVVSSGEALGTLCVIDNKPKELTEKQLQSLKALARQVVAQLELRKKLIELEHSQALLIENNKDLETFTHVLSHDLKTPLRSLATMSQWLKNDCSDQLSEQGKELVSLISEQSTKIIDLMSAVKEFISSARTIERDTKIELAPFLKNIADSIDNPDKLKLEIAGSLKGVLANEAALRQVFWNLLSNACKYSDKDYAEVTITAEQEQGQAILKVSDNGPGIDPKYHTKIFEVFESLNTHDRFGQPTTGMGLAIVQRLLNKHGGRVKLESAPGKGTTFIITLPLV